MFIHDLAQLIKRNDFFPKSILFYNDQSIDIQQYQMLLKQIKDIFIVQTNSFSIKVLYAKLRCYKNIHFINQNDIYRFRYDIVSSTSIDEILQMFLADHSKNYQYFHIINECPRYNFLVPCGLCFYKNLLYKEIIKKQEDKKQQPKQHVQTTTDTRIEFKSVVPNIIQNKFQKKLKKINASSGIIDVFCIIQNSSDYKLFLKTIKYFQTYPLTKFFVFLNGSLATKKFDQKLFTKNVIYMKSLNKFEETECYNCMCVLANGQHKLNYKKIDFSRELIDNL